MYKILLINSDKTYSFIQEDDEDFDTTTLAALETKCIDLLYTYNASQILPITSVNYAVDLLWGDPSYPQHYFPGLEPSGTMEPNPTAGTTGYKILIKDSENVFHFYQVSQEITYTSAGGTIMGTGKYEDVDFTTTDFTTLEKTSLDLLKQYPYTSIVPIICIDFKIDLLWTNIEGLTIAMQQANYDVATTQELLDELNE